MRKQRCNEEVCCYAAEVRLHRLDSPAAKFANVDKVWFPMA
jgi:hypothetical protein